jgi:cytochrome c-type biogenesis protein
MNLAETVFGGQLLLAIPIALLAGLVSFASPCVLPLVPGYLAYVGGVATPGTPSGRRRLLTGVALFVLGFAVIFTAYGALFGAAGSWLVQWQDEITRVLGGIVILMGLVFIGQITALQRTIKPRWRPAAGLAGAPVLGIVFGLGWTPCFGPTLIAIQALSFGAGSPMRGALLGLMYCLGLGLPFLAVALGLNWASGSVAFLKRNLRRINVAGGLGLVVIGTLMLTGLWSQWIFQLQSLIGGFVTPI